MNLQSKKISKKELYLLKKGQILMEALALVLFSCAFLAMLSHLYETGKKEIKFSRIGNHKFQK